MAVRHTVALPLSADYAHDARDGFSFFTATTTPPDAPLPPVVEAYLDDLCAFFRSARLIQAHPDNYFQFMRGETWAETAVHFDGAPVEAAELRETKRLLGAFVPLLSGADAMSRLSTLVRDGPPPLPSPFASTAAATAAASAGMASEDADSLRALYAFYAQTRRLMMGRARRPQNDAASVTLLPPSAAARQDRDSAASRAARDRQAKILDLVVSHGMNPKKQHEVRIMRDTVHDLVECCNCGLQERTAAVTNSFDEEYHTATAMPPSHTAAAAAAAAAAVSDTSDTSRSVRVETAINIGEGKGYVSRAVALCDNLQVVGLDCNPAHKERAVERVESLLETSLSSRDGRPRVNLLYEPRGHVASVACRVEASVDWGALLQGHVLTREEGADGACDGCGESCRAHSSSPLPSPSAPAPAVALSSHTKDVTSVTPTPQGVESGAAVLSHTRAEETIKLACRLCGKVVRLENTLVVMKHVYAHLREAAASPAVEAQHASASASAASLGVPSTAQVREWNLTLSQHAYVAKLTEGFFTVTDVDARHGEAQRKAALMKRTRDDAEGEGTAGGGTDVAEEGREEATASYLTLHRNPSAADAKGEEGVEGGRADTITLRPAHTARGYRAVLLLARAVPVDVAAADGAAATEAADRPPSPPLTPTPEAGESDADAPQQTPITTTTAKPSTRWVYEEHLATIVGYDGGAEAHHVCLDIDGKKRTLRLYRFPSTPGSAAATPELMQLTAPPTAATAQAARVGDWQLPDAALWGVGKVAVVRTVLPPALPSTPTVLVPSVRNTILLGLHPCGDLGSNVCRIFTNSAARGLLLVSCCWHSLTPLGFPLSHALRRRGMTTNSVSLLLATQPLDAWSSASPEGHRSSAKLLFYRSLFKLLWAQLAREWAAEGHVCPSHSARDEEQQGGGARRDENEDQEGAQGECSFPAPPPHLEPVFLRRLSRDKDTMTFPAFVAAAAAEYLYKETAKDTPYTPWNIGYRCAACRDAQEAFVRAALTQRALPQQLADLYDKEHFARFLGLTVLRMWMCHLVESLFLLDRTLYLHEALRSGGEDSAVSLVPLFDGALSPRMYGILARRGGSA